jgi:hypothetical protein
MNEMRKQLGARTDVGQKWYRTSTSCTKILLTCTFGQVVGTRACNFGRGRGKKLG